MQREIIFTEHAPQPIGTYSQAVRVNTTVYLSGQIPLAPDSMQLVSGGIEEQVRQVFNNLLAVAKAAGGSLSDIVKLNVYLVNLAEFPYINKIMAEYIAEPYPARAALGVSALPMGAAVEIDGVMELNS